MHTIGSISQQITITPDMNKKTGKGPGKEHIFFNVHKIYSGLGSFTFQSTLHIKCDNVFTLKLEQVLQSAYNFNDRILTVTDFKEIVEKLYSDSLASLQEHIENSKRNAQRNMPDITIPENLLNNYFASMNYKDLYQSCFGSI